MVVYLFSRFIFYNSIHDLCIVISVILGYDFYDVNFFIPIFFMIVSVNTRCLRLLFFCCMGWLELLGIIVSGWVGFLFISISSFVFFLKVKSKKLICWLTSISRNNRIS